MRSAIYPTSLPQRTQAQPDGWRLLQLALVVLCCVWMIPQPAQAKGGKGSQRCLHHGDCPSGFQCLQRRCFKGLSGVVGGRTVAAYKIAIPKVRWFGAPSPHARRLQHKLWIQVTNNFKSLPGTFNVLNPAGFLEQPPYNGIDIGTFYFKPWQSIKTNGLIKIGVRKKGKSQFTLMFRYYDVDSSKMVVRSNVTIDGKQFRWKLHKLCDKVYKYLTNNDGIFSTLIAYVKRNRKGGKDIWISDVDGANQRRVVSNGKINVLPRWTPDGRALIFTSYLTGGAHLYKLDLATKRVRRLFSRPGTFTGGVVSPNGQRIAFAMTPRGSNQSADIYTGNIDGTGVKRLTTSWGIDVSPTWSPDGKRMAFVSERFTTPQIFFMNADGSNQVRLTFKGNYNQEPRWSPRGNEILFTARDEFLQYDLFVIRLDKEPSGQLKPSYRRLTQNQGTNLEATWSPDGRYVLFVSTRVGERKLYIMNTDGSKQQLFIRGWGNYATPAWSPVMKQPIIGNDRQYFTKIQYIGYKKDVLGNFVMDNSPQPAPAKAPPTQKTPIDRKAAPKARKAPTPKRDEPKAPAKRDAPDKRKAPAKREGDDKKAPAKRDAPDKRAEPKERDAPKKRDVKKTPAKRSQPTKRREG